MSSSTNSSQWFNLIFFSHRVKSLAFPLLQFPSIVIVSNKVGIFLDEIFFIADHQNFSEFFWTYFMGIKIILWRLNTKNHDTGENFMDFWIQTFFISIRIFSYSIENRFLSAFFLWKFIILWAFVHIFLFIFRPFIREFYLIFRTLSGIFSFVRLKTIFKIKSRSVLCFVFGWQWMFLHVLQN